MIWTVLKTMRDEGKVIPAGTRVMVLPPRTPRTAAYARVRFLDEMRDQQGKIIPKAFLPRDNLGRRLPNGKVITHADSASE